MRDPGSGRTVPPAKAGVQEPRAHRLSPWAPAVAGGTDGAGRVDISRAGAEFTSKPNREKIPYDPYAGRAAVAWRIARRAVPSPPPATAQKSAAPYDERPAKLAPRDDAYGYIRRVVDIPMRDGTKLHTVIAIPKGAKGVGMLMTRTPYDAEELASVTARHLCQPAGGGRYRSGPDHRIGLYPRVPGPCAACTRARAST